MTSLSNTGGISSASSPASNDEHSFDEGSGSSLLLLWGACPTSLSGVGAEVTTVSVDPFRLIPSEPEIIFVVLGTRGLGTAAAGDGVAMGMYGSSAWFPGRGCEDGGTARAGAMCRYV